MSFLLSAVVSDLYPALNATSAADLVWWTDDELYQWSDEVGHRLVEACGGFTERATFPVAAGGSIYGLPLSHAATVHVSIDGAALRPATVGELEARDAAWRSAAPASPQRFLLDAAGLSSIVFYPAPAGPGTAAHIRRIFPTLRAGATVTAPLVYQDYLWYGILAEALRHESDAMMPEVSDHCAQVLTVLEKAAQGYWGGPR